MNRIAMNSRQKWSSVLNTVEYETPMKDNLAIEGKLFFRIVERQLQILLGRGEFLEQLPIKSIKCNSLPFNGIISYLNFMSNISIDIGLS
ncbi:hypothetical protein PMI05_05653 [Brevibacillus sp. BC25]|nr:hypothetical protein PMI05_05653 [Brevibacillus sp. BC25]